VLAAAPILVSAFLLVTVALILPLGLILARHLLPTEPRRPHLAALPIRRTPRPARYRQIARAAVGHPLRAPPTFPDQPCEIPPRVSRRV